MINIVSFYFLWSTVLIILFVLFNNQDLEFLSSHKIKYIVNCAANKIPCTFLNQGLNYFRINWLISDVKKISKIAKNSFFSQIKMFFEMAKENFSPVLVHCSNGQGRSFIVVVLYLMSKSAFN